MPSCSHWNEFCVAFSLTVVSRCYCRTKQWYNLHIFLDTWVKLAHLLWFYFVNNTMKYLLSHKLATFSFLYKMWLTIRWGNDLVFLYLANSTWPVNPPNISWISDFCKAGKHIRSRSILFPTLGNTFWESRKIKWPNWDLKDLSSKWHLYRSYCHLGMMFHFKFICQCVETFSIGTVKALVCIHGTWKPKALRQVSRHRGLQALDINSAEVVRTCSKHSILLQV